MKRLLKKLANTDIINILNDFKQKYDPLKQSTFWIKQADQPYQTWILFQAVIFTLQDKGINNIDEQKILSVINDYCEKNIYPLFNSLRINPKIKVILDSKYDENLTIDFDPANTTERDGPVVIAREFKRNGVEDHVFIGKKGETHGQIQDRHKDVIAHSVDKDGTLVICHANYWHPLVFITGYNQYPSLKEVGQIIKQKRPEIKKVYSFNGGIHGGIIHKEAKKKLINCN